MNRTVPHLGIGHIALRCVDLGAMVEFYCDHLGYRVVWQPDEANVYLTSGRDNLALHAGGQGAETRLDHFGLLLESPAQVDALAQFLQSRGVALAQHPRTHRDGARSFYVHDPDGNLIQFLSFAEKAELAD